MKVFRSTLLVGAAVFAAACGDKISGVKNGVQSVVVAPASATIAKGATINLTAAVSADVGVAITPVAWTSSDATKASVDATGKVTGVAATPGVAICAAIGGKSGCSSIIVTEAGTSPAQVSIQSVTVGNLFTPAPVPPGITAGQINITLNVNANSVAIKKVEALIDNVVCNTQTFTAAQSAALQSAAGMVGEQVPPSIITLSCNTAAYDPATFVTQFKNGLRTISARTTGVFAGGTTTSTSTSTNTVQLLLGNADTFAATITTTPSPAVGGITKTAANALGFLYTRGNLQVVANPIIYTGNRTIGTGTVSFGNVGCQTANSTKIGPQTATLAATGASFTATLNLDGYEFNGCPAFNATGESVTFSAVDNLGNQFLVGAVPVNTGAATMFRIDNQGPTAPVLNASTAAPTRPGPLGSMPKGRTSFWLNDVVAFNGLATSNAAAPTGGLTSDGFICNNATLVTVGNCLAGQIAPLDLGVGGTVYSLAVAPGTVAATAAAGATLANATTLAPSATNAGYCGIAYAADALGNLSKANPVASVAADCAGQIAAGNLNIVTFGVDRAPPTIAFANSSLAANARINSATLGGEFIVTVADTGAVGNSGLAPVAAGPLAGPVLMLLQKRPGTNVVANLDAAGNPTTFTTPISTNVVFAAPLGSTAITGQSTVAANAAYWTVTALAQDAAGNQSAPITRVVAGDNSPAVATAPAVPATITGAFSAAAFLNDNLSLRDYFFTVSWGGGPGNVTLAAAPTVIDAYNSATLTNTNFPLNASINTYLALQDGTGASPAAYVPGAFPLNNLNLFARDQTQAAYTAAPATPLAVTAPAASAGINVTGFTSYVAGTSAATACAAAAASAGCVVGPATPATVNWTAVSTGATGTFNNPFSRVDFYANTGAGDFALIGSVPAGSATLVDNGATRVWTYTLPGLSANALFLQFGGIPGGAPGAAVALNIRAFGVNSTGSVALVSAAVTQNINP